LLNTILQLFFHKNLYLFFKKCFPQTPTGASPLDPTGGFPSPRLPGLGPHGQKFPAPALRTTALGTVSLRRGCVSLQRDFAYWTTVIQHWTRQ